jgi:REP element-mobilizing transposase RayT
VIIDSFHNLSARSKIKVYGFVIMPNHMHCIWEMIEMVGKEKPYASFNKFTSHQFLNLLRSNDAEQLKSFAVPNDKERRHNFWQRDPLAVRLDSRAKALQKLDYIHLNPLNSRWNLAEKPEDYKWSSARFYETGVDQFEFLTHIGERF